MRFVKQCVARILPGSTKRRLKRTYRAFMGRHPIDDKPANAATFSDRAQPSPLVTDVFYRIRHIPGWFNIDDCGHFSIILKYQTAIGITGDLFEVGSYFGRSAAVLGAHLAKGEQLVACDAFELPTEGHYANRPTPELLMKNIMNACGSGLASESIEIHPCLSTELKLEDAPRFRFAHVDGGHSAEIALHDMLFCARRLVAQGVLVVDDYMNPAWPGVAEAVEQFQAAHPEFVLLADLNRYGALGRKLYYLKADRE